MAGERPDWIGPPIATGIDGLTVYPLEPGT